MDEARVVQDQTDAYNARDLDRLLTYYSADAIIEDAAGTVMVQGHDAMRGLYGSLFSQSLDLHLEIPRRIHVGQWVVDEEHYTGVHLEGFPPEFTAVAVYQVSSGKIMRVRLLL
jgi:hypothetical protein